MLISPKFWLEVEIFVLNNANAEGLQKKHFEIFWKFPGEYYDLFWFRESCKHASCNFKNACLDVFLVIFISYCNACCCWFSRIRQFFDGWFYYSNAIFFSVVLILMENFYGIKFQVIHPFHIFHFWQFDFILNFSEQVLLGNINTITEKCFFIGGNPNCICVARVSNVVEGD